MTGRELACGCLYVAAHQAWAWGVRLAIEPWARRSVGRRLGVSVAWVPATTFPVEIWTWGLVDRLDARLDARLAASSVGIVVLAALAPAAAVAFLLRRIACSQQLTHALYLVTLPLMGLFVLQQTKRRREVRAEDEAIDEKQARRSTSREKRARPSKERGVP